MGNIGIKSTPEEEHKKPSNNPIVSLGKGSGIPLEERSMRDLFPDLNVANLMEIDRLETVSNIHKEYVKNPIPKVDVEFSKPIPKPSFQELRDIPTLITKPQIQPYARYIGK